MRESDIIHEHGNYWVSREKTNFTVWRVNGTHSVSDSAYERTDDGKSLAIARCDYLANRADPTFRGLTAS